ncbi:MAG: hypothetical protein U1E26_07665 [Coriobacteriia bacterium]|nr:hypothetical protein [Coriobacteriia bacterium]
MAKITGGMRERLDGIIGFIRSFMGAREFETDAPGGCSPRLMLGLVIGLAVIITLYVTGVIAYDFTLTPAERAAVDAAGPTDGDTAADSGVDPQLPGEPYLDGRHYAIIGTGDAGTSRVYTIELLGEGDSGAIRVWEDDTGRGTYTIAEGSIRIEMERMVPPEDPAGWEPNVFEGTISSDESRIEGTWTRRGWFRDAHAGTFELEDWTDYGCYAERL